MQLKQGWVNLGRNKAQISQTIRACVSEPDIAGQRLSAREMQIDLAQEKRKYKTKYIKRKQASFFFFQIYLLLLTYIKNFLRRRVEKGRESRMKKVNT